MRVADPAQSGGSPLNGNRALLVHALRYGRHDVGLRCSGYGRQRALGTVVLVRLRDDPLSAEKAAIAAVADSGRDVGRGAGFEISRVEFGHARREVKRVDAGVSDAEDDDVDPVG